MKILVGAVAAICVIAGVATANAAQRHRKNWVGYDAPSRHEKQRHPNAYGWYPHDSNELAVGSRIWWDQMEREGRLGGRPH
jgi:hypothetical protein